MTADNWLALIGILSSGIVGYWVKYFLDKKAQFSTKNAEIKRKMYQDFVNIVIDFFDHTKQQKHNDTQVVKKIFSFYRQYVLYASPEVISSFSELMQYFYKNGDTSEAIKTTIDDPQAALKKMTNVFKCMRKDIGLSNRGLGDDGEKLLRAIINDYDEMIK
jgi:hypothetical protein